MIAESIIAAAKDIGGFKMPVVVRLQGTNSEKGLKLVSNMMVNGVESRAYNVDRSKNRVWSIWW